MSLNLSNSEKILHGPNKTSRQTSGKFSRGNIYISNHRIIFEATERRGNDCNIPLHKAKDFIYKPAGWVVVAMLTIVKSNNLSETFTASWAEPNIVDNLAEIRKTYILKKAKRHERLLEFEEAAEMYKLYGLDKDVIRVREKARNKVEQTVVHGDYVDDRDTVIKDSVVSKSNVGVGSDDKIAKLEKIAEMKDKGIIDDAEFKQMKKEILGK